MEALRSVPVLVIVLLSLLTVLLGAVAVMLWQLNQRAMKLRRDLSVRGLLALFGPAAVAAQENPKQLLVWQPVARTARELFPDAFAKLDAASGGSFPFSKEQLQAAHDRCSSDWLAWERAHDAEYALKTAVVHDEIARAGGQPTPLLKTRLAAVEQEKLERYQQRYEEYIRTAKALVAFV